MSESVDALEQERQKMKNAMKDAKRKLEERITQYLESVPSVNKDNKVKEFEFRFGKYSKNGKNISKIDYDNVVKAITSAGFVCENKDGVQMLRIYSEYLKPNGQIALSNIRAEIIGVDMISEYCASNSLEKLIQLPSTELNKLKFTNKTSVVGEDGKYLAPIDFPDMGLRADYKLEQDFGMKSNIARKIIEKWQDNKKKFRLINRVRYEHSQFPIAVDISIVKSSQQVKGVDLLAYTIQESRVFDGVEKYEIEMEIINERVGIQQKELVMDSLRKVIRIIMSGLQGSNYPIMLSERDDVLQEYLKLIHGEDNYKHRWVGPKDFIGPSSYTLQLDNIVEKTKDSKTPNIRENYTVTDKADGERKMLFVNGEGKIYLLDSNMNVQFTGAVAGKLNEKMMRNSLVDGEHIKYDKNGEFINLYKAFDIYFASGKNVMEIPFIPKPEMDVPTENKPEDKSEEKEDPELKEKNLTRLKLLNKFIDKLKPVSILPENNIIWKKAMKNGRPIWLNMKSGETSEVEPPLYGKTPACKIRVECKQFYSCTPTTSIFNCCSNILTNVKDNLFEYETDGLIFTPAYAHVGSVSAKIPGPLHKYTWDLSFKWKPAEFNTVDFLVAVEKDKSGAKDKISYIHQEGNNFSAVNYILQYKTLRLHCGFDSKKHAVENAFNDILHERIPKTEDIDDEETYEPRPFEPTEPYDPLASVCYIMVKEGGERDERSLVMTTESGEYFEENMIVEFRYDKSADPGWNWKPIRVRYDKTQKLLRGDKEYGNAYHVANSNWSSIHNEITENMIMTGNGIPEPTSVTNSGDDAYYANIKNSNTTCMRNFHNLYVKKTLIMGVANQGDMLIDYAVGKAGDLPKWRQANLSMVLGIDLSRDNITGSTDSACIRYLKNAAKYSRMPYCMFVKGNSSLNIRSGDAFPGEKTSKEKMVVDALFGKGPKDEVLLGSGIYKRYGVAEKGFQISSCQFAIHYFFETPITLHSFMRNIAECTRLNGYFVCTGYDGRKIFDLLKRKREDEGVAFVVKDRYGKDNKICEIIKKYSQDGFAEDETSIGYAIHVFQETIQKTSREFLVSFKYLLRIMENYGFELIKDEEARQMGIPHSSGLFHELYEEMEKEVRQNSDKTANYKNALNMSSEEKQISFLNRYCIFRKTTQVSKETLDQFEKIAKSQYNKDDRFEEANTMESLVVKVENEKAPSKGRIKKIKARVILRKKSSDLKGDDIEAVIPDLNSEEKTEKEEQKEEQKEEEKAEEPKAEEQKAEEQKAEEKVEQKVEEEKPKIKLTGKKIKITKK